MKHKSKRAENKKEDDKRTNILKCARSLLIEDGYPSFSMRKVASKAGIHLKTLQHYFSTKQDLILETTNFILDTYYFSQYVDLFNKIDKSSSVGALSEVIGYLVRDTRVEETSKFFSEMWALSFRDEAAKTALDTFYVRHRHQLELLIARANTQIDHKTVKLRAAVIASQIEGLVPLIGFAKPDHSAFHNIEREVRDRIMQYALAP